MTRPTGRKPPRHPRPPCGPQLNSRRAAAEPFPAWHRAATELAAEMDADVIDGAGVAVTLHAYAGIGQELQGIYAQLETLGLPAGSAAARRLFS